MYQSVGEITRLGCIKCRGLTSGDESNTIYSVVLVFNNPTILNFFKGSI